MLGPRSFVVYGPVIWNWLPTSIRNTELSLNCFRQELKTVYCLRDQARSWRPPTIRASEYQISELNWT